MQVHKALDELKWIHKGLEDARRWRDWDEVARLRGRVSHAMALLKPTIVTPNRLVNDERKQMEPPDPWNVTFPVGQQKWNEMRQRNMSGPKQLKRRLAAFMLDYASNGGLTPTAGQELARLVDEELEHVIGFIINDPAMIKPRVYTDADAEVWVDGYDDNPFGVTSTP